MKRVDGDNSDNYGEQNDEFVRDVSESVSDIPKADGIDNYLRDVDVAVQDIINLFKATLETVERSLSKHPDSPSLEKDSETFNVDEEFPLEETGKICSAETGNDAGGTPKDISKPAHEFLTKLTFLVYYIEKRTNVSPIQQQEQDRKLRHANRSRRRTETDIKLLNDALAVQRIEHKKSVDKLNEELNKCRNASDQKAEEIKDDISRIVNESETKMVNFYKESITRQELLQSEIKILETKLNNLRRDNILMEKELRDKRCRVEIHLLDCVGKYDVDIGGRHKDMENLSKEFQLLNAQRKMLEEDVMINLRTLQDDLQQEKAEALQKILNERVEKFVRNRAARIIQRAWRAYWERHCAKKKRKSRKK